MLTSYLIACPTYDDKAKADLVKGFLTYVVSEQGQQEAADNAGSAPDPGVLRGAGQEDRRLDLRQVSTGAHHTVSTVEAKASVTQASLG